MKKWICAGALALAVAGCKDQQPNTADTAKNNPQLGAPSAAGGPAGTVSGKSDGTMQRQTPAGTPGGPTDDLGGHTDAGPLDGGTDAGPR